MIKIRNFIYSISIVILLSNFVQSQQTVTPIIHLSVNTTINPAVSEYIKKGVNTAEERSASALVISINTPGGLLTSMQTIVEDILRAKVPVIVYVSPAGGGAISAGVFITLAGHIAVMSPGTTIGAAHPVASGGENIGDDMRSKAENFAASLVKAIAEQRGRNMEWAEKAVRESVTLTDSEAIKQKVVDYSAENLEIVLEKAQGRKIKLEGKDFILPNLKGLSIIEVPMSFQQRVVSTISDPNIMALLSLAAMGGIMAELYNPGLIFPGLIGVVSLVLTLVAGQVIPINVGGGLLLLLGIGLITAELFLPSFGIFGIAGVICMVLGSIYAIDSSMIWAAEGFQFNPFLIGSIAGFLGIGMVFIVFYVVRARNAVVLTGQEGLIGQNAIVNKDFEELKSKKGVYGGKVLVNGEIWNAYCLYEHAKPLLGEKVIIEEVEGLLVKVRPG